MPVLRRPNFDVRAQITDGASKIRMP
jgi:hypothetical protein